MRFLQNIDNAILLFINGAHTPLLDKIMWITSIRATWIPLYLLFAYSIIRKFPKRWWMIFLFVILAIVLSDQVSNLIKNEVMRLRPSHTPGLMEHLHYYTASGESYMGGLYGFVSNHAANAASFAVFIILLLKNRLISILLVCWVVLIGYSRVYLGVHFPSDVLGGALLGVITGSLAYKGYGLVRSKIP